jgi:hypothetical protein
MVCARDGGLPFWIEDGGQRSARPARLRWKPVGMGLVKPDQGTEAGDQASERMVTRPGAWARTG